VSDLITPVALIEVVGLAVAVAAAVVVGVVASAAATMNMGVVAVDAMNVPTVTSSSSKLKQHVAPNQTLLEFLRQFLDLGFSCQVCPDLPPGVHSLAMLNCRRSKKKKILLRRRFLRLSRFGIEPGGSG
jgi:hypothetical protein